MTVDNYIENEAAKMRAGRLRELGAFVASLQSKLDGAKPELRTTGTALLRVLASPEVRAASDPLPPHLAEAGVAAEYLLKGVDLIPDQVEGIGLDDDAIVVGKVFSRNPVLGSIADHAQ